MATFKEQLESLKGKLADAELRVTAAEEKAKEFYMKGMQEARDFDAEMDTFLVKFMKRDDSSFIIFLVVLGLMLASGAIGWFARGFL